MTLRQPARRALIAFALIAVAQALAAQVYTLPPPDPVAQAAAQRKLRRIEAKLVRRLEKSHGDPAAGARLGEALRSVGEDRLDHPSTAVRAAIAAARDPAALALAGDAEGLSDTATTYETDALLIALSLPGSRPRRAELWAKAATVARRADVSLRIAFLERAYGSLVEASGAPPAGKPPDAFALASLRLDALLGEGLAHEAVAAFDALPAALRDRLVAAGGGTTVEGYIRPDPRLGLAAARLLDGDESGARALLARTPIKAWSPADGNLTSSCRCEPMEIWRALLERSLAGAGNDPAHGDDDPFPVLAEFAATDLFGPGTAVRGVGVVAYARLAERERYPAVAAFAWRRAAGAYEASPEPDLLPLAAARTVRRLRAAMAEQAKAAEAAMLADFRAAGEHPRPAVRSTRDGARLDQSPHAVLLVLDRAGRRGLLILDSPPFYGELYRLEAHDDGMVGVLFGSWIS